MWKPLEDYQNVSHNGFILCACSCGKESKVRVTSILNSETHSCKSCAMRIRMLSVPPDRRREIATKASLIAAELKLAASDAYAVKYGEDNLTSTYNCLNSAKQRCTNPNANQYVDYGLRGISFDFPSVRSGAEWILDNLGVKPSTTHSLDRIDNNKGYTPGNLRWATRSEQARNKRTYKRTKNGERIKEIMNQRQDLTYETIRLWVKQGRTDEQILNSTKYSRYTP